MLRRLLMVGGGTGGFRPPHVVTLTASPHGGYTHIPDSKATSYNGKTWIGYITAAGAVEIVEYVHASGVATITEIVVASDWLNADTHGSPSVLVRDSDKKLIVSASRHDGATPYIWVSTSAESAASFAAGVQPDASIGGSDYTYMSTFQLLSEASDPIYLFYRDISSGTGRLAYSKSTDGGATWSARSVFYTGASGIVPYWRMWSNGTDRVDFVVTDKEWYDQTHPSQVGHFYYTGGQFYKSDGTHITATQPFGFSDITLVKDTSEGMVWCMGVSWDGSAPACVLMTGIGSTDNAIGVARWNGSAWSYVEVARHGGIYSGDRAGPLAAIDHADPNTVYLSRLVSGKYELFRYVSADSGATWTGTQLTVGSTADNLWVESVKDHTAIEVVWEQGTFVSSTSTGSNTLGIMGLGS